MPNKFENMKMTPEEIINYCHSGVLESVTAEQLLQVVEFYEDAEPSCSECQHDTGYENGHPDDIGEMGELDSM